MMIKTFQPCVLRTVEMCIYIISVKHILFLCTHDKCYIDYMSKCALMFC